MASTPAMDAAAACAGMAEVVEERRRAIFEASGEATFVDAVSMTALTGAGVALALVSAVLQGGMAPEDAVDAMAGAMEEIALETEIHDIERSSE